VPSIPNVEYGSAQAYRELYHQKELLIRIGSTELQGDSFAKLAETITSLTRDGIHIILAYGGNAHIDALWNNKHPTKKRVTDTFAAVSPIYMNDAVLPAAASIQKQLTEAFPKIHVVEPKDIECIFQDGLKHRVKPRKITIPTSSLITAVGFVGTAKGVHVHSKPNDIAKNLILDYRDRIHDIIFLSPAGGLIDNGGNVVPLILEHGIQEILKNNHPRIHAKGSTHEELQEIASFLPIAGKIAVTSAENLQTEIESWKGSGTLFVDSKQLFCSPLRPVEEKIFEDMYAEHVHTKRFRPRSHEELQKEKGNYYMLRIHSSPIGGFSLMEHEDNWLELSILWSGYAGNGVGPHLIAAAKNKASTMYQNAFGDCKIFSLSTDQNLSDLFTKSGFKHHGKKSELKNTASLPSYIQNYPYDRDPHIFTYTVTARRD
jgi:hypothetical protein